MYAIVDIAGQQFKVAKDQKFYVNRLKGEAGSSVEFSEALLLDNEGTVTIGTPLVEGAKVSATIVAHLRGDKVKIFKKKRRKGYQKETGHRQDLTQVKIEAINA
jgi:large subunit ribosomal protein L21